MIKKMLTILLIAMSLSLIVVESGMGQNYFSKSDAWSFQDNCILNFKQATNFSEVPHLGITDSSLAGYWNFDEGSGIIAHDSSGNGNNGTINGAIWAQGKYGPALEFNGSNSSVTLASIPLINNSYTVSFWFKPAKLNQTQSIINFRGTNNNNYPVIYFFNYPSGINRLLLYCGDSKYLYSSKVFSESDLNQWWQAVFVVNGSSSKNWKCYLNGVDNSGPYADSGIYYEPSSPGLIGSNNGNAYFNGTIDDVKTYNLALNKEQVLALYTQPNPLSLANYYNFKDPITDNIMLIHVDSLNTVTNDTTLVTCTNFFEGNKLVFQANSSASVNVWTTVGQPIHITNGFWNDENSTATLAFDANTTAELSWSLGSPPSASNLFISSSVAGVTSAFSALWTDNESLLGGGYIFSTNNTGKWVNASWSPFSTNPDWGNATLGLNGAVGVTVGFKEYANDSLNLWSESEIYTNTTAVDSGPKSTPSPTLTMIPSASPNSTPTPTARSTPTKTPISTPTQTPNQTNAFPAGTILLTGTAIGVLVAFLALILKKGYVTIKVIDEEESEETSEDYII
jgi:hypothetical protein